MQLRFAHPSFARLRAPRGFSLAEVSCAIGITAFAMVAILGFIPRGLDRLRDAANLTTESRIANFITGEMQQADFDKVASGTGWTAGTIKLAETGPSEAASVKLYYFDDQGVLKNSYDQSVVYTARACIPSTPNHVVLPGATTGSSHLKRVVVQVTDRPISNFNFEDASNARYIRYFSSIIARMDKQPQS